MTTHVLLIDSPDEKGLVHRITGVLLKHGANVVSNHEFVDRINTQFFMRTEFSGEIDARQVEAELRRELPKIASVQIASNAPRKIVVLATKEAHCLGDLLVRNEFGELGAQIVAVIANHDTLGSLVERFHIPFHFLSHENVSREEHEQSVLSTLSKYQPDYVVLAKYMRILSPQFVEPFKNRMINIHHSFLPAFIGAQPYRQAFERGVKIIGATAHFVTDGLDTGPIIAQSTITIDHADTVADMARFGRDVEKIVLAKALRLVFENRVFLSGDRTVIFE